MTRRKARAQRVGACAYCAETKPLTRDHVIPKALFLPPFPPNMITVPACNDCNSKKSLADTYLRDYIVSDAFGSQHPDAEALFRGPVLRSHARGSSDLARTALETAKIRSIHTEAGIYLGELPQGQVDVSRITTALTYVSRGLYFDHRKTRIPSDYAVQIHRVMPWHFQELAKVFDVPGINGPRALGEVFLCQYMAATENPFFTFWLLSFFGKVVFTVSFEPATPREAA